MKKIKIAYILDSYHPIINGVTTFVDACVRYMTDRGNEVLIIAPDYPNISDGGPWEGKVPIKRLKSFGLWFTTNRYERAIYPNYKRLAAVLDEFQPDVIHVNMELIGGFLARHYALKNNIPIVATAHTNFAPYFHIYVPWLPKFLSNWIISFGSRRFYQKINKIMTPSQEMANVLINEFRIKSPIEISTIGIDASEFDGVEREKELKNSRYFEKYPRIKERKRLLFVGRISEEKNVSFLLKVLKRILEIRQDIELLLVGGTSFKDYYQKKVQDMGINEHVTFMGLIRRSEIKYVYAIADIFTFPSVTETQGLVTAEALYNGVPAVAIGSMGSLTVLKDEKGGFLTKEDISEFSEKVIQLLEDKDLYLQKKAEAFERGKELSFNMTGQAILDAYISVLKDKNK